MNKELVNIKKVEGHRGLNTCDSTLSFGFEDKENDGFGLMFEVGKDPEIVNILKRVFGVSSLKELEGKQMTLVKQDGDFRTLAVGVDGQSYLYRRGKTRARYIEEKELEPLVESKEEPKPEYPFDREGFFF